jgi:hypothetical protein
MAEKITISQESEWTKLTDQSIETVVDPMVYRCGELFTKGAKKARADKFSEISDLLIKNIYSIGTFFDCMILYDKLPVFNYADTFDSQHNFGDLISPELNDKEQVFFDVDVTYGAYRQIKDKTLEELGTIYKGENKISAKLVKDILKELAWAEYNWTPHLEQLEQQIKDSDELKLARFLLGGLIFGKYAEKIGGEHLLQPKRSELLVSLSLNKMNTKKFDLFEELKKNFVESEDIPWRPTFFPYLLSRSNSAKGILDEVIRLRKTSEVKDYRQWWKEITGEWQMGKITIRKRKEVETIRKAFEKKLFTGSSAPQVEVKADLAALFTGKFPVEAKINLMPLFKTIWGSTVNLLPGKRHRKLLLRLLIADKEYHNLNTAVYKVWQNS